MRHYVIAYPHIDEKSLALIQGYRKQYDHLYEVIDPHFTLVFATEIPSAEFVEEIKKQSHSLPAFDFSLRCAVVNKDGFRDMYYTFLVPDEGFSRFIRMHDVLYAERLFEFLRLDIDYIPHIEIARSEDKLVCKRLAEEWNKSGAVISGRIAEIQVATFEQLKLNLLLTIPLKTHS